MSNFPDGTQLNDAHLNDAHLNDAHLNDESLSAQLREWQAPAASPWLAGRIAAQVIAGVAANTNWSLFPGPLKVRVAALAFAVVVGWSAGAFVSTPEASADDGVELAEIMW